MSELNRQSIVPKRGGGGNAQVSYNVALSDCWNNGDTCGSPQPSTSASCSPTGGITSCLLCPNLVKMNSSDAETEEITEKRLKLIQNLCYQLSLDETTLPTDGTERKFPLCGVCMSLMTTLMSLTETLKKVEKEIGKTLKTIERAVADKQILGGRGPPSPIESERCVELYDMILAGYRAKLMEKQEINNSLVLGSSSFQPGGLPEFIDLPSDPAATGMESTSEEKIEVKVNPFDIGVQFNGDEDETLSREDWSTGDPETTATYNHKNCTLTISEVPSAEGGENRSVPGEFEGDRDSTSNIYVTIPALLKQEVVNQVDEVEMESDAVEGISADIIPIETAKRRHFHKGVEIYTTYRNNSPHWQCSACNLALENVNQTALKELKAHIEHEHRGVAKPRRKPKRSAKRSGTNISATRGAAVVGRAFAVPTSSGNTGSGTFASSSGSFGRVKKIRQSDGVPKEKVGGREPIPSTSAAAMASYFD